MKLFDIERYCPDAVLLNYTNPMAMLCRAMQEKFPKLYSKVNAGEIVIDKVEQQLDKNGEMKYRVTYSHKDDADDFDLLWQTIYMPMLLGD